MGCDLLLAGEGIGSFCQVPEKTGNPGSFPFNGKRAQTLLLATLLTHQRELFFPLSEVSFDAAVASASG